MMREAAAHLRLDAIDLPVGLEAFGRDDPVGGDYLADMAVVALAVELDVGEDQPDRRPLVGGADERAQRGAVIKRPLTRGLP